MSVDNNCLQLSSVDKNVGTYPYIESSKMNWNTLSEHNINASSYTLEDQDQMRKRSLSIPVGGPGPAWHPTLVLSWMWKSAYYCTDDRRPHSIYVVLWSVRLWCLKMRRSWRQCQGGWGWVLVPWTGLWEWSETQSKLLSQLRSVCLSRERLMSWLKFEGHTFKFGIIGLNIRVEVDGRPYCYCWSRHEKYRTQHERCERTLPSWWMNLNVRTHGGWEEMPWTNWNCSAEIRLKKREHGGIYYCCREDVEIYSRSLPKICRLCSPHGC